jgi:phosphatidylserine/phosphatidylglycerophosphate/cardiolipin synthase-like enzyme
MVVDATREPPIVPDAKGTVAPGKTATLTDPYDPVDTAWQPWFDAAQVSFGNEVVPYIDPNKLFKDMVAAIRTAKSPGHFVGLLAWNADQDFELIAGDPTTTLKSLLPSADAAGARVSAMVYHQDSRFGARDNTPIVTTIGGLKHGMAVHDDRVMQLTGASYLAASALGYSRAVGAHHQKVLVVSGEQGLIGFQGGVDIDPDRRSLGGGLGLHDVHTRLIGPAAWFLYSGFMKRWNEHPLSAKAPLPPLPTPANQPDNLAIQVAHTYPNGATNPGLAPGGYSFAPSGDRSLKAMLLRGIANAKEFIYLEDQYLVDMAISNALKAALPNVKKLIILALRTDSWPCSA